MQAADAEHPGQSPSLHRALVVLVVTVFLILLHAPAAQPPIHTCLSTTCVSSRSARIPLLPQPPYPFQYNIQQIKADLIRQCEAELLVPAAGPNASEVLRLLRPAALSPPPPDAAVGAAVAAPSLAKSPSQCMAASTAHSAADAPISAATESKRASDSAAAAAGLLGLSCAISAGGEVRHPAKSPNPPPFSLASASCHPKAPSSSPFRRKVKCVRKAHLVGLGPRPSAGPRAALLLCTWRCRCSGYSSCPSFVRCNSTQSTTE